MLEHSLSGPVTYKGAYAIEYMHFRKRNGLPFMTEVMFITGAPTCSLDPTLIYARPGGFCSFRGGGGGDFVSTV
jgi:hypothetical protein